MACQGGKEPVHQVIGGRHGMVLQKQRLTQSSGCDRFVGIHIDKREEEARWEGKSRPRSDPHVADTAACHPLARRLGSVPER